MLSHFFSSELYKNVQFIVHEALKKDGVLRVYLGPRKLYVVVDPEDCLTLLNACLKKHYLYDFTKPLCGNGLLTSDVPTWKKNRKLLNPAFNQQVLIGFMDVFNFQAQKLVNQFARNINKQFDHEKILRINNLKTICMTITGVGAKGYDDLQKQYLPRLEELLGICNERFNKFWLHGNTIYNWSLLKKRQDEEMKHVVSLADSIIQKKKAEMSEPAYTENKSGNFKPFLELILELAKDNSNFTDEHIRGEINTILAAGHDTDSSALTIALTLLGSNLSVQEKAYDEIVQVIGNSERDLYHEDLPKLVYIEAILKETLRLYPTAPIIARQLDKDVKLRNYTLKANSGCIIGINGAHRHRIWGPDANDFRPERWFDKETLPDPKYYAAFGLGRRFCIGKTFAMMLMKIYLVHILRRYRISSDASKMVLQMNTLLRPSSGFHISLEERNVKY